MSDENEKKPLPEQVQSALVGVAAAGVGAGLASLVAPPTEAAFLGSAFGATIVGVVNRFRSRNENRAKKLWDAICSDPSKSREEAEEEIRAKASDPDVQDAIIESLRQLMDAIDEAVIPVMAALVREYVLHGQKVDWFFRGLARLLSECSATELADVREVIRAAMGLDGDVTFAVAHESEIERMVLRNTTGRQFSEDRNRVRATVDGFRVVDLLMRNGLARTANEGPKVAITIRGNTVRRLHRLLSAATPE